VYGGYLTLSIDGSSKHLVNGIEMAHDLGLTIINVVNVEDSAVTRVISEKGHQHKREVQETFEDSVTEDASSTLYEIEESIGMYTKLGFCYSDLKAFVP
jgi:D-arabinose 5-phosphate isomerase GutQ